MHAAQGQREHDGHHVSQHVLERVGILRGQGHGRGEAVVLLVEARVEFRMVQGAVGGVVDQLAQEESVGKIGDEFARDGVGGGDGEGGVLEACGVGEGEVQGDGE